MNEHEFDRNNSPRLELHEIQALQQLAIDYGEPRLADYPQLQSDLLPKFYTLKIDAEIFDRRWKQEMPNNTEFIRTLEIEYNESMINEDGTEIKPAVAVDMVSYVAIESGDFAEREVRYLLPLDPADPATAEEYRSDDVHEYYDGDTARLSDEELMDALGAVVDRMNRPLTHDDVRLLQLLISQP